MTHANKQRGEVKINGPEGELKLCLTLGAIAQLEDELQIESLTEIDSVMSKASMKHLLVIVKALLAGGGNPIGDDQMMAWQVDFQELMGKIREAFAAAGFGSDEDTDEDDEGGESEGNG